jgi:hypothetical protein
MDDVFNHSYTELRFEPIILIPQGKVACGILSVFLRERAPAILLQSVTLTYFLSMSSTSSQLVLLFQNFVCKVGTFYFNLLSEV